MLKSLWRAVSFRNISAAYLLVLIIIVFSVWKPQLYPNLTNIKVILDQNAVTALIALSLVAALSTATFDLSVGSIMALASVTIAWLMVQHGEGIAVTFVVTLAVALAVGALNGFIVTVLGIDSFIGTLGTGAVFAALNLLLSGDRSMSNGNLSNNFSRITTASIGGIAVPVFVMIGVTALLWWTMEHTVTGRHLYATGFNPDAARLAGVRTRKLQFITLLVSALVAGLAGILLTSQLGSSSPDIGPPYLLDAFAAAFLGATQIRPGRFNAFGTVLAVYVLGAGTTGLTLVAAPVWTSSLFTGLILLVALWLSKVRRRQTRRESAAGSGSREPRAGRAAYPSVIEDGVGGRSPDAEEVARIIGPSDGELSEEI
jgi:ribose transport system permease protein